MKVTENGIVGRQHASMHNTPATVKGFKEFSSAIKGELNLTIELV